MRVSRRQVGYVVTSLLFAVLVVGCGGGEERVFNSAGAPLQTGEESATASKAADEAGEASAPAAPGAENSGGSGMTPGRKATTTPRKIIYTAEVNLVVEQLNPAQQKLLALVKKHGGYIAETNVGGRSGQPRTGRWKVRVPVDGYQNFLDAVTKIGEVQTVSSNSQDVSEEYYDIEARLRNKRLEEKRLLDHLNRSTAKLSDILLIEKEISRVRGEIEQMTGRRRVLANLTALTTITITINEVKDYVPPAPPTFATEIARTFEGSLKGLIGFGKGLVLLVVGFAPWLVVIALIAFPLWRVLRRRETNPQP